MFNILHCKNLKVIMIINAVKFLSIIRVINGKFKYCIFHVGVKYL